ncbi:MAG: IS66 family transposase [Firmicutes bacterium]|nr:IS66 family transposase [Bacillota bacterium]
MGAERAHAPLKTASLPRPVSPGSLASASLLAVTRHQQLTAHRPLYRQAHEGARLGIPLSRQPLANGVIYGTQTGLKPVYEVLKQTLVAQAIIQADETTLTVIHEPGRQATQKSYMWLYRSGREGLPIVLDEYQPGRHGAYARRFLTGFQGYLQCDGYAGYREVPGATLVGCWAHARRHFVEALQTLPAAARDGPSAIREGLEFCNTIFRIERELRDLTPAERQAARQTRSRPALAQCARWLRAQKRQPWPQSPLGKAVTSCLNQGNPLTRFLEDGRLDADHNRSDRAINPFVTGRKHGLFANTPRGAPASAIALSFIQTATEKGWEPRSYLPYLFEPLPQRDLADPARWADGLPWSPPLPAPVKAPGRASPTADSTEAAPSQNTRAPRCRGGEDFTLTQRLLGSARRRNFFAPDPTAHLSRKHRPSPVSSAPRSMTYRHCLSFFLPCS